MKPSISRTLLSLGLAMILPACAIVSTGHKVDINQVNEFKVGETTPEEVKTVLGEPENVARNTIDHTTVYSYQWIRNAFLGIGLPPWIVVGRKKDTGFQLNIAFAGDLYQGYTLTELNQKLFGRENSGTASAGAAPAAAALPSEKLTMEFSHPEKVPLQGYDGDLMEPFLSHDNQYLFFNNSNVPGEKTDLFYARRTPDGGFRFVGPVKGANLPPPVLDGVASMDRNHRFYFTTTRDYANSFLTIYSGNFTKEVLTDVAPVLGDFSRGKLKWVTMDVEVSEDGNTIYCSDAYFPSLEKGVPGLSDIKIARKSPDGRFLLLPDTDAILRNVNTPDLEYAPSISPDERELFFTRLRLKDLHTTILRAKRKSAADPFDVPEALAAVTGFVEAPTLAPDGKTLYYHKKDGNRFALYQVTRE